MLKRKDSTLLSPKSAKIASAAESKHGENEFLLNKDCENRTYFVMVHVPQYYALRHIAILIMEMEVVSFINTFQPESEYHKIII